MGAGVLRIYSLPPSAFKGKILIKEIFPCMASMWLGIMACPLP